VGRTRSGWAYKKYKKIMDKYYYDLFCSYIGQYNVDHWQEHVDTLNSIMWEDEQKNIAHYDYVYNIYV
jgi:hypothetical protein